MENTFSFEFKRLMKEYNLLSVKTSEQISHTAYEIYGHSRHSMTVIRLEEPLLIGNYDPLISGCPSIEEMHIIETQVSLKFNMSDEVEDVNTMETLSLKDKLDILGFLENHLREISIT